jgi:hypothetical protein
MPRRLLQGNLTGERIRVNGAAVRRKPGRRQYCRCLWFLRLAAATQIWAASGQTSHLNAKFPVDELMARNGRFKQPLGS